MNENLHELSREDLEAAIRYWQPKAMHADQELKRLKHSEKLISKMKFWRRLRWALTGK